jgi:hypothetical protein
MQQAVADCPLVVDEHNHAEPGVRLRGRLELLPAAVPRSLQHHQRRSRFLTHSRRHHDPVQDHAPTADEGHVGGLDGLRLGGRWCNRDTHGCEEDGQQPADARSGRHGRFSAVGDSNAHHGRNQGVRSPLAAGDSSDRFSTYAGSGSANQNRTSSTRYGRDSPASPPRSSSFAVGTGAREPIQMTSS